jgi:glycosyltransferase involved in cell wall biosynthesis
MPHQVAVLMAAYNAENTIAQALDSLLQGSHPCKVYIVDDCSRVPVADVIKTDDDERVEIIRLERNAGPAGARNAGLARILANGHEYVAIMDADDLSHPDRLAKQAAFLSAHSMVAAVGCWERVIDETSEFVAFAAMPCDPSRIRDTLFIKMCISHPSLMMRTAIFKSIGLYRQSYYAAEDYELVRRIAARYDVANLPEYLIEYRISTGGMTQRHRRRQLIDRLRIQLSYFDPFKWQAWYGVARTTTQLVVPVKRKLPDTMDPNRAKAVSVA